MQRVRLRKISNVKDRPFPSPEITLDELSRIVVLRYEYQSIILLYIATWLGQTNFLDTYTQVITDKTTP